MSDRDWLSIKNLEIDDGMDGLKNDLSNSCSARNGTTQLWNTEKQQMSNRQWHWDAVYRLLVTIHDERYQYGNTSLFQNCHTHWYAYVISLKDFKSWKSNMYCHFPTNLLIWTRFYDEVLKKLKFMHWRFEIQTWIQSPKLSTVKEDTQCIGVYSH